MLRNRPRSESNYYGGGTMINSKTLNAVAALAEAIQALSSGGPAFKKNMSKLEDAVTRANTAVGEASDARGDLARLLTVQQEERADLDAREAAIGTKQAKAERVIAGASEIKSDLAAQRDYLTSAAGDIKTAQDALGTAQRLHANASASKDAELTTREATLAVAEARVERILSAAAG